MIEALLEGIVWGLTLAVFGGPVFFALIQISVEFGFKSAMAFALGVFLSDLLYVVLAYIGASQLLDTEQNKLIVGVIGGAILIVFGMLNVFKKKPREGVELHINKVKLPFLALKGFLINAFNPFVIIFWLSVVSYGSNKFHFIQRGTLVFIAGILGTVIITDIIKSYIAIKIRNVLRPNVLLLINKLAGLIIAVLGVSLIYRVVF